jgi:hypothetical protein
LSCPANLSIKYAMQYLFHAQSLACAKPNALLHRGGLQDKETSYSFFKIRPKQNLQKCDAR